MDQADGERLDQMMREIQEAKRSAAVATWLAYSALILQLIAFAIGLWGDKKWW